MNAIVRNATILVLVVLTSACAGLSRPKPEWSTAPGADLAAFSTFDWGSGSGGKPQSVLYAQTRNALLRELEQRGYQESAQSPDFLVSYELVEHERGRRGSPVTIGIGMGTWGRRVGGHVGTSVGVGGEPGESYRLVIRALDPDRTRELWIGATTSFELPADEAEVARVVAGAMRGFPAKAADGGDER